MKFISYDHKIINCNEIKRVQYTHKGIYISFYFDDQWFIKHDNECENSYLFYTIGLFLNSNSSLINSNSLIKNTMPLE